MSRSMITVELSLVIVIMLIKKRITYYHPFLSCCLQVTGLQHNAFLSTFVFIMHKDRNITVTLIFASDLSPIFTHRSTYILKQINTTMAGRSSDLLKC